MSVKRITVKNFSTPGKGKSNWVKLRRLKDEKIDFSDILKGNGLLRFARIQDLSIYTGKCVSAAAVRRVVAVDEEHGIHLGHSEKHAGHQKAFRRIVLALLFVSGLVLTGSSLRALAG